jgi:hypothetical protein
LNAVGSALALGFIDPNQTPTLSLDVRLKKQVLSLGSRRRRRRRGREGFVE